jgi:YfiH family protein
VTLLLRFADCQPILLYDPVRHVLGLIHAGWRGVALGIAGRAVETMQETFGSRPGDLVAGLGPAIGPCCYTVGQNVAAAMGYALPDWSKVMHPLQEGAWQFDLPGANAQQLKAAGVRRAEQAGLCTACHTDEFFSHRGDNGHTGRFAVAAYLQAHHGREETAAPDPTGQPPEQEEPEGPPSVNPPGFPGFEEFVEGSQ